MAAGRYPARFASTTPSSRFGLGRVCGLVCRLLAEGGLESREVRRDSGRFRKLGERGGDLVLA